MSTQESMTTRGGKALKSTSLQTSGTATGFDPNILANRLQATGISSPGESGGSNSATLGNQQKAVVQPITERGLGLTEEENLVDYGEEDIEGGINKEDAFNGEKEETEEGIWEGETQVIEARVGEGDRNSRTTTNADGLGMVV